MPSKQLILMATGTTVVGGGIATGSYFLLQEDNSVSKQLIKEDKKILDINADNAYWEIKLSTYTREQKSKHDLNLTKDEVKYLKEWCTSTLKSTFNNKEDKNYSSAKELCIVPTNKERLLKEEKKLATTEHWSTKETEYKRTDNQNLISTIEKTTAKAADIKAWCNSNINNEYNKNDQTMNSLTLKWCTQEGK